MQIGGLGSIPYRTVQFSNGQSCSLASGRDRTRPSAEFGVRIADSRNSAFRIRDSALEWRGCSSVGRAVALQAIGREFESPQLHQSESRETSVESRKRLSAGPSTLVPGPVWGRVAQLVRACA